MSEAPRRLYLFSSDQSPQYAQDVLNVLGAPEGKPYTFRYEAKYVHEAARVAWDALQDVSVLVVFSLQQRARFHDPAFVPIRAGRVLRTFRQGDTYFVTFRVGGYVSLLEPPLEVEGSRPDLRVRAFTALLGTLTAVPYEVSASLGGPLPAEAVDETAEASVLFSRTGVYLSATAAFAQGQFVRALGIRETGVGTAFLATTDVDPVLTLEAGRTYEIELFHAQPKAPTDPQQFAVQVDGSIIQSIGRPGFEIASRYDRITVRFAATRSVGLEVRETIIVIEPADEVQGPSFQFDVRVRADRGRTVGLAGLQSVALIAVALAGVLASVPLAARIMLGVVGALAAVGLGLLGGTALTIPRLASRP